MKFNLLSYLIKAPSKIDDVTRHPRFSVSPSGVSINAFFGLFSIFLTVIFREYSVEISSTMLYYFLHN